MGSGIGSIPVDGLLNAIGEVFAATVPGRFKIATQGASLAEVQRIWTVDDNKCRVVFTM